MGMSLRDWVDPRGCGGDLCDRAGIHQDQGGSPRVRGRHRHRVPVAENSGWIPAGAGETTSPSPIPIPIGVDPRGCGGDLNSIPWRINPPGGSPRVRGRLAQTIAPTSQQGWIPAGAGETADSAVLATDCRVDPRGCGGDVPKTSEWMTRTGGSPRVRGRPHRAHDAVDGLGWIPAGAGETLGLADIEDGHWVDPRGCGGDRVIRRCDRPTSGGSPRVRGRLRRPVDLSPRPGWIPAGAGETATCSAAAPARGVDPRGCGGDAGPPPKPSDAGGGSPRVRGRRRGTEPALAFRGWIPAGAGETWRCRLRQERGGVDPRGCGGD